eukprot:08084.XXX_157920_159577_1 [CDS] Oithona nana genome sequencing.
MFDLVQVSNDNKMSSLFKKEEIMALNNQEKCNFILRELTKLLNLSSIQELYFEPVLKALFETHYIKLYRQEALRIFHPESQVSSKKTKAKIISKNITKVAIIDLKCPHEGCEKTFKKKAGYRKHVNYFHLKEGSGVPCDQCGIIYQNFFYLRIHKRQAHEHVTCKECDEIFIGENELGRHRRKVHLTGNEHICEVCGQGFKMRFYMKRHKRQHHPELVNSPYYCTDCNRHFGTNRKLRDHMTGAHFKTRPYKCRAGDQICDKAFYNVNLRRKHERQVHQLHIYTPSGTKSNKIVDLLNPIDQQQQEMQ